MNDWDDTIVSLTTGPVSGPVLFKRASTGAIQRWQIETLGNKFRTVHGQFGGNLITSEWTVCEGKNIGKKNETSPEKQAELEVAALYKKKREQGGYHDDIADIDNFVYVNPMLANKFDAKKVKWPVTAQAKLDGMRCIVTKSGCYSRKGKEIPAAAHIREQLQPLFEKYPELILDGELYNHTFKDRFQELMSICKKQKLTEEDKAKAAKYLNYHAYDLPSSTDWYPERWKMVDELLGVGDNHRSPTDGEQSYATNYPNVFSLDCYENIKDENGVLKVFSEFVELGYEGLIIRDQKTPYENKRTNQLMKYKSFIDEEFEIADLEEGKGNWTDCAKRAIFWLPGADKSKGICEETTFGAGIAGSKEYTKDLLARKGDAIGKLATVTFFRWTDDGKPYLPVMKAIRDYE